MKVNIHNIIFGFVLFFFCITSYGSENAFYVLHNKTQSDKKINVNLITVNEHHRSIQLLISQAYHIDDKGNLIGFVNDDLVSLAKSRSIKFMALITNQSFDQAKIQTFLASSVAQQKAIRAILAECKKYHFYGVQFDFENVSVKDRRRLTQFFMHAANALHQAGFKVSYAVIPAFADSVTKSTFLKKSYQNWSGAYDLKALGKSGDFVTIMAYNQHPDGTIPGPNASINFVRAAIKNALKDIPANKISLGIPTYSLYWYSGNKISARLSEISFADANKLIKKYHSQIFWNKNDKVHQAVYERNWLNEYIYLEDASSFKAKIALAKQFKLRGISVFRIGTEDSRIWTQLK